MWRMIPKKGYVALGHVVTIGKRKPILNQFRSNNFKIKLIFKSYNNRCIREDITRGFPGRPKSHDCALRHNKYSFYAWIPDSKTCNFFIGTEANAPPPSKELRLLKTNGSEKSMFISNFTDQSYEIKCGNYIII